MSLIKNGNILPGVIEQLSHALLFETTIKILSDNKCLCKYVNIETNWVKMQWTKKKPHTVTAAVKLLDLDVNRNRYIQTETANIRRKLQQIMIIIT